MSDGHDASDGGLGNATGTQTPGTQHAGAQAKPPQVGEAKLSCLLRVMLLFSVVFGVAVLLALIRFFPVPEHTNFWDSVFDTGHILIFGSLAVLLLVGATITAGRRGLVGQYLVCGSVALAIGIGVEYWQQFNNRSSELIDVVNDLIGIVSFSMVFAIFDQRISEPRKGWLRRGVLFFVSVALVLVGCIPLFRMSGLYRERRAAMPQLVRFQESWEGIFFYAQSADFVPLSDGPADWPTGWPKDRVLSGWAPIGRLVLTPGRYPGLVVHEPFGDWTGYKYLEFDVLREADTPRTFILRIHDKFHDNLANDRFRKTLEIQPGFQSIRIPLAQVEAGPMLRKSHLQYIAGLTLFTVDLAETESIYLGNMRLSR